MKVAALGYACPFSAISPGSAFLSEHDGERYIGIRVAGIEPGAVAISFSSGERIPVFRAEKSVQDVVVYIPRIEIVLSWRKTDLRNGMCEYGDICLLGEDDENLVFRYEEELPYSQYLLNLTSGKTSPIADKQHYQFLINHWVIKADVCGKLRQLVIHSGPDCEPLDI